MNCIILTTGREVFWSRIPSKDHKLDIRFCQLKDSDGHPIAPMDEERREAANRINQIIQPDQENFNAS